MKQYVIKRLLATVPLLLVISFLCFCFINLIPSDPAEVALRMRQTPIITEEAIAEVRRELGLDQPFFVRYAVWLWNCLQGDFGVSYTIPPAPCWANSPAACPPRFRSPACRSST